MSVMVVDPSTPEPSRDPPRGTWLAVPVVLGCGLLVALSLLAARDTLDLRGELLARLDAAGVPEDGRRAVERETTPHHARLHAARALVYNALVRVREPASPERRHALAALPDARRLAADVLHRQPNSWQASMLYGTAIYLERSIARDRRLVTEARAWERPLEQAVRDAPGQPEPRRLLTSAYLEIWPHLSAAKRERTRELVTRVFRDDARAFEALAPAWLGLGLDREATFSVVPDDPAAWRVFETTFARARRWDDAAAAHERHQRALEQRLDAARGEAEARLRLGDYFRARSMLLRVVVQAPPSHRFAPLVERALEIYPPGLHGLSTPDRLRGWIEHAIELDRLAVASLSPVAAGRLLDAVGELDPPVAAHAALIAGDLYQAERFERLAQPLTLAVWAPYLMAKARRLAVDGDREGAREVLDQVALGARSGLEYAIAEARLLPTGRRSADLDALRATRWDALAWRWRRGRPVLEMLPATPAGGLALRLEGDGWGRRGDRSAPRRTLARRPGGATGPGRSFRRVGRGAASPVRGGDRRRSRRHARRGLVGGGRVAGGVARAIGLGRHLGIEEDRLALTWRARR